MSALPRPQAVLLPLTEALLDRLMPIEQAAYEFPWSRGNFVDSLKAGYQAQVLVGTGGELLGYFVAMRGVEEAHLLNITVAPGEQGRGHARTMLDALCGWARAAGARHLWLEVRVSNVRARDIYERYGFRAVGTRRAYYPAAEQRCEDALVMSLSL